MRIVAWIFLVYSLSSLSTYMLIAQGRQQKMLMINACIAVVNLVGNMIVIPQYSFIGSAWMTLASQILLLILTVYHVRKG
jgi:O-antigen/teichoic acid export membrane protein